MTRRRCQMRNLRLAIGTLTASIGFGCGPVGCKQPSSASTTASAEPTEAHPQARGSRGLDGTSAQGQRHPAASPVLPDAALQARVMAQRSLLGRSGVLFEDESGSPIPWISNDVGELDPFEAPVDDELLANLPGSSGLGGSRPSTVTVNGNELGTFTTIEQSEGADPALAAFHASLRALGRGEDPDGKVRILVFGASHTDADIFPHYIRTYLQQRFGDGGHGFVHVARPWSWYGHVDMEPEDSRHWRADYWLRRDARQDGFYGLMGVSMSSRTKKAVTRVIHRNGSAASRYEFYFLVQPRGGSFRIEVDGKRVTTVSTRGEAFAPGYHDLHLEEGSHEIEIRPMGNGEVRLFGLTAERDQPGVVVDTLGIGGARAANILQADEAIWADNVMRRDPALFMLAYGTNEATYSDQPIEAYQAELRTVIERLQTAAPEASCLLVGPGDFPLQGEDGSWMPRPRLVQIVETQRQAAAEMGCGFWDALSFMGGEMSMTRWVAATPPMGKGDHVHLTRRGYVRMGMALTDALMLEFDASDQALAKAQRTPSHQGP